MKPVSKRIVFFASLSNRCQFDRSQSSQLYPGKKKDFIDPGVSFNAYNVDCVTLYQVLVWHTRTVQVPVVTLRPPAKTPAESSIPALLHALDELKLATGSAKVKQDQTLVDYQLVDSNLIIKNINIGL